MPPKHNGPNRTLDILSSIGDQAFLGAEVMQNLRDHGLRVDRIAIALIRPDAAQPRRVLPETIHQVFHNQEITPIQALKQYIEKVRIVAREKGRPFETLLDLLMAGEENEGSTQLTPLEQDLRDLTNLAVTLRQDGQVNPLTIVDHSQGAVPSYIIETGERRYWANYIDMEFIPGYQGDGMIPCIILQPHQASVFRQAKENTSRAGLNAIGMARQAALLLLAVHGIHPPDGCVTPDFYRQALDLDLRSKREYSTDVLSAMGGISRQRLSQYKLLLGLPDEALELADRYSLEERVLRYVLQLPVEMQSEAVRQIVQHDLDVNQVRRMLDEAQEVAPKGSVPARNSLQFARLIQAKEVPSVEEIAQILLDQEEDVVILRRKVELLREVLVELERHLEG
ncbi:MAG: hypothetical protein BroJett018_21320 [Chloroflexota bacterium]|nr:hypothetical protein [Chloroflexota bacterium]NOG65425.1 hypothetical protein [Chloroflexota bacterium]GIK64338.1 MAG: hypothetical protein BroJett018_21320 [Chloroflexota bacterium]